MTHLAASVLALMAQADRLSLAASDLRKQARQLHREVQLYAASRTIENTPNHMNKSAFARLCGVSRETVRRWERDGKVWFQPDGKIYKPDAIRYIQNELPKRAVQLGITE